MSARVDGLCRLCLRDIGHYGTRISIYKNAGLQSDLASKISSCLPVSLNNCDSLPKYICRPCSTKVDYVYNFRAVCAKSESELKEMVHISNANDVHVPFQNNSQKRDSFESEFLGNDEHMVIDKTTSNTPLQEVAGQYSEIPMLILQEIPILAESALQTTSELIILPPFPFQPVQDLVDNLEYNPNFPIENLMVSNPVPLLIPPEITSNLQPEEHSNVIIPICKQDLFISSFTCSVCGQQCTSHADLVLHFNLNHIDNTPELPASSQCKTGASLTITKQIPMHTNTSLEFPKLEQENDCQSCVEIQNIEAKSQLRFQEIQNSSSFNINDLETGVLNVSMQNQNSKKDYFCVCGKEFQKFEILENHAEKCHLTLRTNENYQTCEGCKNKFQNKQELEMHLRKNLENLKCTYCAFRCRDNETLQTHRWHCYKRNWPFECPNCHERFLVSMELQLHATEKHPVASNYSFVCDICKGQFKENYDLKTHRNTHFPIATNFVAKTSNELKENKYAENFCCDFCKMNFVSKQSIEYHMMVHLAEREKLSVTITQLNGADKLN